MSLVDQLKSGGAFTGRPVEKEVTWHNDGEEMKVTVYVRPLSYQSAVSDIVSQATKGDAVAGRIAACICDDEGKPVFTPAYITGDADPDCGPLCQELTMALLAAIGEVSGAGKRKS